jgi:hypothetical protein
MGMSMMTHGKGRLAGTALMLTAGTFVLSGCIGGPTYGTDKTAAEQLLDDLGNVATIRPQGGDINYQPRPDLVRPPSTGALPPPQPSVAQAGSQTWPESPEQARARLVAEADAGGTNYRSPLAQRAQAGPRGRVIGGSEADSAPLPTAANTRDAQAEFRQARAIQDGRDPTRRAFLSEPPLEYRQPAATAPVGELGESERAKEQRRLANAERPGSGRRWWPF